MVHTTARDQWRLERAAEADEATELGPWLLRIGLEYAASKGFTRAAAIEAVPGESRRDDAKEIARAEPDEMNEAMRRTSEAVTAKLKESFEKTRAQKEERQRKKRA